MDCVLLADGRRIDVANLVGHGIDGFIVREGCNVWKIPKLYGRIQPNGTIEADSDNELHLGHLDNEKQVYARLQGVAGVARCLEQTSNGILLEYYVNGSLADYVASKEPPSIQCRWDWVLQATEVIARCHRRGVLIFDVALRNFLLANDFSLRLIDFSNSALAPDGMDVTISGVDGCTVPLDLLHLSNVIYSILTWRKFSIDCAFESEWPSTDQMPDLAGLDCETIIRKCWQREYKATEELAADIQNCKTSSSPRPLNQRAQSETPPVISVQSSSLEIPPA